MKNAEKTLSDYYNKFGWKTECEITEDAKQFEDLRDCAKEYLTKCRNRVLKFIPHSGENILDMASGPIQYPEYLDYSKNFFKRYCVDLSNEALDEAKNKIGDHGVYINDSFFNINFPSNFFDCSISLHTIYHMDKNMQAEAVKKLISVTKKNHPIIIVYSNPNTLLKKMSNLKNSIKNRKIHNKEFYSLGENQEIYFYLHPIEWWNQFQDTCNLKIYPWRSFLSDTQKKYFPNNIIGKSMFKILFLLESLFPNYFVKNFQYIIVVLEKK